MKRFVKKITAVALVITMLGGANVVSAAQYEDLQSGKEQERVQATEKASTSKLEMAGMKTKTSVSAKEATRGTTINATALAYETSKKPVYQTANITDGTYLVPISVKADGVLWIDAKWKSGAGTTTVQVTDKDIEYQYGVNATVNVSSTAKQKNYGCGCPVKAGQTYYIMLSNNYSASAEVRAYIYSSMQNRILSTTKWRLTSPYIVDPKDSRMIKWISTYYALTPAKTGTISVELKEYGRATSSGYITLYDKNKKQISEKVQYSTALASYRAYFGVKKGTKYYVKVDNCYGALSDGYHYGIKYTNTSGIDRALGSKTSAKKLERKAAATASVFVASNEKSTDWYKFYVASKRTTQFSVDTSEIKSGDIKITVYAGSKLVGTSTIKQASGGSTYTITHGTTTGKANAGTYYVKVEKQPKTSGKYKIRYVQ